MTPRTPETAPESPMILAEILKNPEKKDFLEHCASLDSPITVEIARDIVEQRDTMTTQAQLDAIGEIDAAYGWPEKLMPSSVIYAEGNTGDANLYVMMDKAYQGEQVGKSDITNFAGSFLTFKPIGVGETAPPINLMQQVAIAHPAVLRFWTLFPDFAQSLSEKITSTSTRPGVSSAYTTALREYDLGDKSLLQAIRLSHGIIRHLITPQDTKHQYVRMGYGETDQIVTDAGIELAQ